MRLIRHLFDFGRAKRAFPPATLDAIQKAIATSENGHAGEIVFAVEGALPAAAVLRKLGPRERAHEVFGRLRVWNTEHNTGVLVYVLLADHAIEIVADRGIARRVADGEWRDVCARMQARFATGDYEAGAITGVEGVTALLLQHFPADGTRTADELPDRPVLL